MRKKSDFNFYIYQSNQQEILLDILSRVVQQPLKFPFEKEQILVQSLGMERWLSLKLAKKLGIWANGYFPYPRRALWSVFQKLDFGNLQEQDNLFGKNYLCWLILRILDDLNENDHPDYEEIFSYLKDDNEAQANLRKYQLADSIAGVFDTYLTYRPKMLLEWESGTDSDNMSSTEKWQFRLWKEVVKEIPQDHFARMVEKFGELIFQTNKGTPKPKISTQRISIFGVSYIAPQIMEAIKSLSHLVEIHLFLFNPCQEYWSDVVTASTQVSMPSDVATYYDTGMPLLSSLGILGKDYISKINELESDFGLKIINQKYFIPPEVDSWLHLIQYDVLKLKNREQEDFPDFLNSEYQSFQVHSCHSVAREVEILYDQVLGILENNPDIDPEDILVMSPNIDQYTPIIQSIFESANEDKSSRIQFHIVGHTSNEDSLSNVFLKLLEVTRKRFQVSEILDFLGIELVYQSFGLSSDDVETIIRWVEKVRIHWGKNAAHRQSVGLPNTSENTWQEGIKRLLLGYGMLGDHDYFQGIIPYDDIEGSENAIILGKFLDFYNFVEKVSAELKKEFTLSQWKEKLVFWLERFQLDDSDFVLQFSSVREELELLDTLEEKSKLTKKISIRILQQWLKKHLIEKERKQNFLGYGVTFSSMYAMRNIPFKVICLLGMEGKNFPKNEYRPDFDLMAKEYQRGDYSKRLDDRYLFLETLLSARDIFYISYVGRSIENNDNIEPSNVVLGVFDYLGQVLDGNKNENKETIMHFVTQHSLQAFNPTYFSEEQDNTGKIFSFSEENLAAAKSLLEQYKQKSVTALFADGISIEREETVEVDVDQLVRFYRNPADFFLKYQLGFTFPKEEGVLSDSEVFKLDGLEKYSVKATLAENFLREKQNLEEPIEEDVSKTLHFLRKAGKIPHENMGGVALESVQSMVSEYVSNVHSEQKEGGEAQVNKIHIQIGKYKIIGNILSQEKLLLLYRPADIKAKDQLKFWLYYLVLLCSSQDLNSRLIGIGAKDKKEISVVENPQDLLLKILEYYEEGLQKPLPFFPDTLWLIAKTLYKEKGTPDRDVAFKAGLKKWSASWNDIPAEKDHEAFQVCFPDDSLESEAVKAEMFKLVEDIFKPMLNHIVEVGK
ncbi:MAG: exodeoxyribonuclease V gamma subunit [bacterium]|jgi:exodeoxyribonuclease V gamma subunit